MGAGYQYLCQSWQGLLQMVVYLSGRGYYFYHVTHLPGKKVDKWPEIDAKLITKYATNKSKWQRARTKNKGLANFMYLRWHDVAIIMHTMGDVEGVVYDDTFSDIRTRPMPVCISELIAIEIYKRGKGYSCRLTAKSYNGFKESLRDIVKLKSVKRIMFEFNKINGIPAYGGVIEQKRKLAKFLISQARKHQLNMSESSLRVVDRRWAVKVWAEDQPALDLLKKTGS